MILLRADIPFVLSLSKHFLDVKFEWLRLHQCPLARTKLSSRRGGAERHADNNNK